MVHCVGKSHTGLRLVPKSVTLNDLGDCIWRGSHRSSGVDSIDKVQRTVKRFLIFWWFLKEVRWALGLWWD